MLRNAEIFYKFVLILLVFSESFNSWATTTKTSSAKECRPHTFPSQSHDIKAEYKTEIVSDEYIVSFRNFYTSATRKKFLKAAFQKACFSKQWRLMPRHNMATKYPSDFDVIQIRNVTSSELALVETLHPAIKRISCQNSVQRILSFQPSAENTTNYDDDDKAFIEDKYSLFDDEEEVENGNEGAGRRRLLRILSNHQIHIEVQANALWSLGVTGVGIRVAIFDTGLAKNHPHFKNVKERTNWTNEKTLDDGVSHGTFVAGVIASKDECKGIAPDAELHVYRVFTNTQVSYTSWFLDAFNYAIFRKINVLNLSIGGPDFLDKPFVEKVLELSANKVIMISAIGNDGPLYGTLNNPGDQSDVIGVGGISFDDKVAKFSSRGMTTWELPIGYGRLKPDLVTYGSQVKGSNVHGGCRSLSGTSVASPVVAGAVALIASGALHKAEYVNPASIKQVLIEGATRLTDNNMFEQGHGKLNILKSMKLLLDYTPKVTLSPAYLDFTDFTYMWPYSMQQLYCNSVPVIVNVTILNGISVTGYIVEEPTWHPYEHQHGELLKVSVSYATDLWPWSGWMSVHIAVSEKACQFEGLARGHVSLTIRTTAAMDGSDLNTNQNDYSSLDSDDTDSNNSSTVHFPITVKIIPKPPRNKRILWDQYHSLRYPPGYIPRDSLKTKSDPLDWRADHIHTNFRDMYNHLRNSGYYIDTLRTPYTCFNATDYGTILIVDPEEEFFEQEIDKLQSDVYDRNLSIIIFADWYNTTVMKKIKFFDENTRQWWIPDTGGSNVPALNELTKPFGIALGDCVAEGYFKMGDHEMYYASGTNIAKIPEIANNKNPEEDILITMELNDYGSEIIENASYVVAGGAAAAVKKIAASSSNIKRQPVAILGMFQMHKDIQEKYYKSAHKYNTILSPVPALSYLESNYISNNDNNANQSLLDRHESELGISKEKNPLLNKRILLNALNKESTFSEETNKELLRPKLSLLVPSLPTAGAPHTSHSAFAASQSSGRIVIYGDSNCLDSTHLEKACFWLLDALLEYTMASYKTDLLKNLNHIGKFRNRFRNDSNNNNNNNKSHLFSSSQLPLRLPSSNLYKYSRVLNNTNPYKKQMLEQCEILHWTKPYDDDNTGGGGDGDVETGDDGKYKIYLKQIQQQLAESLIQRQQQQQQQHYRQKQQKPPNDLQSEKLLYRILEKKFLSLHHVQQQQQQQQQRQQVVRGKNSFIYSSDREAALALDDSSMSFSLTFLVLLTLIVLIFFVNWLKRRRRLSSFIL